MHIVRWLLRSPLALIWTLAAITIFFNWIVGGKTVEHEPKAKENVAAHSSSAEHGKPAEEDEGQR